MHYTIKICGRKQVYLHSFYTLALYTSEWSTSALTLDPGVHWLGGWLGPSLF